MINLTKHALLVVTIGALGYIPIFDRIPGSKAYAQAVQDTTSEFMYNANGQREWAFRPLSRQFRHSYDLLGRMHKRELYGYSNATQYGYDSLNQLTTVTDARNVITQYTVNGHGDNLKLESPDSGVAESTYDLAGNLKTATDGRGQTSNYTYDALNRLTRIDYTGWPSTVYEYDGGSGGTPNLQGKLTKITDESGFTTYSYDALGRLTSKSQTVVVASVSKIHTIQYVYGVGGTANGKLQTVTYPSGNRVTYSYNSFGELSALRLNLANTAGGTDPNTSVDLLKNITYAPVGALKGWIWGNSTVTTSNTYAKTYDLDGRVTSYTLGNSLTTGTIRTLTYDAASRILGYTHTGPSASPIPASLNQTFSYDVLDRLKVNDSATGHNSYSYDANGNRTNLEIGSTNHTNTVSGSSNRLNSTAGPSPAKNNTYDGAGNLLGDGTVSYTYSPGSCQ